ncbi:MAG: hypothetical protein ACLP00_06200, partial [Terracidiphilus sp.]
DGCATTPPPRLVAGGIGIGVGGIVDAVFLLGTGDALGCSGILFGSRSVAINTDRHSGGCMSMDTDLRGRKGMARSASIPASGKW